jgi:hypothetical protein
VQALGNGVIEIIADRNKAVDYLPSFVKILTSYARDLTANETLNNVLGFISEWPDPSPKKMYLAGLIKLVKPNVAFFEDKTAVDLDGMSAPRNTISNHYLETYCRTLCPGSELANILSKKKVEE